MKGSLIAPLILLNNLICPNQIIFNNIHDDNEDENEEEKDDDGDCDNNNEGGDNNLIGPFLKATVLNSPKNLTLTPFFNPMAFFDLNHEESQMNLAVKFARNPMALVDLQGL